MTSSIITFSLSFLALHLFLIKVIFERVLILPLNKSLAVCQKVSLSVISVVLLFPKNVCLAFRIRVTQ